MNALLKGVLCGQVCPIRLVSLILRAVVAGVLIGHLNSLVSWTHDDTRANSA